MIGPAADLGFAGGGLLLLHLLGWPVAALLPADRVRWRCLAAPVAGLAVLAVGATLLYRAGLMPAEAGALLVAAGVLASGAVALRPRPQLRKGAAAVALLAAVVLFLGLAPKWIGGPQFWAFQGNDQDQINYVSYSSAMRFHSYRSLTELTPAEAMANDYLVGAGKMLGARPAVCLAFATLAALTGIGSAEASYPWMVLLQTVTLFAALLVLGNLLAAQPAPAGLLAASLTLGFFLQYVLDIDAWSELAALPLGLAAIMLLVVALEPGGTHRERLRLALALGVLGGGLLHLYPELLFAYGPPALVVLLAAMLRRATPPVVLLDTLGVAAAVALAAAVPLWRGTVGHLVVAARVAAGGEPPWWRYFQAYLLGRDVAHLQPAAAPPDLVTRLYELLSLPADMLAGALGLYHLLPGPEVPLALRAAWKVLLLALIAWLAAAAVAAAREHARDGRLAGLFWAAATGALVPLAIVGLGHYWAAGKALSMVAPLLFLALVAPLALPQGSWRRRLPAALFAAAHLGFGLTRLAAADADGILRPPPYPAVPDPAEKHDLSWDLGRWRPTLAACRRVSLDIPQPPLDRYVQMYLTELGAAWSSALPLNDYYDTGNTLGLQPQLADPDCLVTTRLARLQPGQTVIWLARDSALVDFHRGLRQSIDLLGLGSTQVEATGLHAPEPYRGERLRWTDGDARMTIPIDPAFPVRRIRLELWGVRQPGEHLRLTVDGRTIQDGALPDGDLAFDLPLAPSPVASMVIRIQSESFTPPGDPRRLGLALRRLVLDHGL